MKTIKISGYEMSNADYGPSSPYESTIYLYNELTEEEAEPHVVVEFYVEPSEMEGSYISSHGNIIVESVRLDEDVTIGGKNYRLGTDIDDLSEFLTLNVYEYFADELAKGGTKVPVNRSPSMR
jgi:hypothetical protein